MNVLTKNPLLMTVVRCVLWQ